MSHEALSQEQFRYQFRKAAPNTMESQRDPLRNYHMVQVFHTPTEEATSGRAGQAGHILWHHKTGEIGNIDVSPEYRRRGVATGMYQHAKGLAAETRGVRQPRHSRERTAAGEAWARSLGERLPRRLEFTASASGDWEPAGGQG